MKLNEYQEAALTFIKFPQTLGIIYPTLGLAGETGEVVDKIKKVFRDNGGDFTEGAKMQIIKELGDVLWYISVIAHMLDESLEEVAAVNIDKLDSRKRRNKLGGSGDER